MTCVPREYFSADAQLRALQRKQTSQVRYWTDLKHKQGFVGTDLIFTSNNLSPSAQPMGPAHGPSSRVQPTGPPQESIPAFPVCHMSNKYLHYNICLCVNKLYSKCTSFQSFFYNRVIKYLLSFVSGHMSFIIY